MGNRKPSITLLRLAAVTALLAAIFVLPAASALARKHPPLTEVHVLVTDSKTNKPIFQAALTLEFRDASSRFGKVVSLSAKTDLHGTYTFRFIPMETVVLVVTAPNHQSFGKKFSITEPNQTIKAVMEPPQPLR